MRVPRPVRVDRPAPRAPPPARASARAIADLRGSLVSTAVNAATASASGGAADRRPRAPAHRVAPPGHRRRRSRRRSSRRPPSPPRAVSPARAAPGLSSAAARSSTSTASAARWARPSASASTIAAATRARVVGGALQRRLQARRPRRQAGAGLGHPELEHQPRPLGRARRLLQRTAQVHRGGLGRAAVRRRAGRRHQALHHPGVAARVAGPVDARPPARWRRGPRRACGRPLGARAPGRSGQGVVDARADDRMGEGQRSPRGRGCRPRRAGRRRRPPRRASSSASRAACHSSPRSRIATARASRAADSGSRSRRSRIERPTVRAPIASTCSAAAAVGSIASSRSAAHQLAHEKRRAAGRAQAGLDERRIGRRVEPLGHELPDRGAGERGDADELGARVGGQGRQQPGVGS